MDPFHISVKEPKLRLVSIESRYKGGYVENKEIKNQMTITEIVLSNDGIFTYRKYPDYETGSTDKHKLQDEGTWKVIGKDLITSTLALLFKDGRQLYFQIKDGNKGFLFLNDKRYSIERIV